MADVVFSQSRSCFRPGRAIARAVGVTCLILTMVQTGDALAAEPQRHALLVGVSHYPELGERYQLQGAANDSVLMRDLLVRRFSFSPDSICTLSETSGETDPSLLPTRCNIQREFLRLADSAKPGDEVVIFMAGHGSQQPCSPDDQNPEPDGLDEIFLPRDVGRWNPERATVENAILDNEIGEWLAAIRDKGARVWAVFDCCHSGGMTRSIGDVNRFVPAEGPDGLGIPSEAMQEARQRTGAAVRSPGRDPAGPLEFDLTRMAVLYACQPHEKAIERELPAGSGARHGLLTYHLCSVLSRGVGPLSYNELSKRIHNEYLASGRVAGPTPLIEGGDVQRHVLGAEQAARTPILLTEDPQTGTLQIDKGHLHGLTTGSVLAVYPPPAQAGNRVVDDPQGPLGHVRITRIRASWAEVEPCEYLGAPKLARRTILGRRCEVVEVDYGDQRLKVAVASDDAADSAAGSEGALLRRVLSELSNEKNSLLQVVDDPASAVWFVQARRGDVFSAPISAWTEGSGADPERGIDHCIRSYLLGPLDDAEALKKRLRDSLHRVARGVNLLRLAIEGEGDHSPNARAPLPVETTLHRLHGDGDRLLSPSAELHEGDRVQLAVRNPGNVAIDVTVLYLDSEYGLSVVFPRQNEINRVEPGRSRPLPRLEVTSDTEGQEFFIILAVPARGQPVSFAALAEPTLVTRSSGSGPRNPLERLLTNALHGTGATRSVPVADRIDSFHVEAVPVWIGRRPKEIRQ